ncbi:MULTISPECIES: YggS family pyridoxal phosphate-dependent enzyme [Psychrilyobacter]|uniref:Pyridoxal phosphate homeostasis protein n=1 Tax=Psychrilyobacter piezotolerans TaxID=2293438 RepID=A0ABX9KKW4_9FUSO|nr:MULTISPECIES: YggS family pyridoxal phosphate-dependent enzyme [Psychrilyobacter]MCS5420389.1 YggS family pyridoxal phosphate-dependent enzyme [Psychrilyobacter sp. S5]NDI76399.1 YggS family pyridoxal phosphate-dependent enzyme [Psychrilyobacter piezotolerans]RDE65995.1 YggS family pyridoxal phosphate-dependent enzyme [Psychrilyobacter sp. S5]REI43173.1 YggS family pyridoxal phosphate-dependent enzyme [Psychrilyobacter piezotolerans]
MGIRENILELKSEIEKYSPNPGVVTLLPTTKYVDAHGVLEVVKAGCRVVGENRVQALEEKRNILETLETGDIKWHFIGNLQKNKVKYIAPYIEMIHSVNKISLAEEIDKRAKQNNRRIKVLLEVNISKEESKEGYSIERLYEELPNLLKFENIEICGLMTMAPFTEEEKVVRKVFSDLKTLKDELNKTHFNGSLIELSMGMTNDYKIALSEGATILRVGSKIFK